MDTNWQSWAVFLIVGITAVIFLRNILRKSSGKGCGGSCGCHIKRNEVIEKVIKAQEKNH